MLVQVTKVSLLTIYFSIQLFIGESLSPSTQHFWPPFLLSEPAVDKRPQTTLSNCSALTARPLFLLLEEIFRSDIEAIGSKQKVHVIKPDTSRASSAATVPLTGQHELFYSRLSKEEKTLLTCDSFLRRLATTRAVPLDNGRYVPFQLCSNGLTLFVLV